jgi:signal transduction histidine kinase
MPSSGGRRLGLLGMAERVSQVGGRIEVNSEPGRGSEIVVRIPIGGDEGEPSCE